MWPNTSNTSSVLLPVRRITRIGYLVTSREMAIWPPKLGTLYILFSELFLWPKSGLFPQGFAHNTIEQQRFVEWRRKWRFAKLSRVGRPKPCHFVLFLLCFRLDRTPHKWKNQVRSIFCPLWKKYVVNVYEICFYMVLFLCGCMTASLGPRLLKMQ